MFNLMKAQKFLSTLPEYTRQKVEAERIRQKAIFERILYQAETADDIADISLEDMLNATREVDMHLNGGKSTAEYTFNCISERCEQWEQSIPDSRIV